MPDDFAGGCVAATLLWIMLLIPITLAVIGCTEEQVHKDAVAHGAGTYVTSGGSPTFRWNDE